MKSRFVLCVTVIAVCAALAMPVSLAAQDKKDRKHHHYKLIDLGTLGGPQSFGDGLHGAAINNRGIATGVADTATPNPNYPNCSSDPFVSHAFLTQDGTLTDLGALPGEAVSSGPTFITTNGLLSGASENGSIDPITGCPELNAVLWKDSQIINLGTFGGYESSAYSVNSQGQVTGYATNTIPDPFSAFYFSLNGLTNGTQMRGFVWDEKSGMQDMGTLGGADTWPMWMNQSAQISGCSYTNFTANSKTGVPTTDPFLWDKGTMLDLGTLGGTFGCSNAINNRGQVVGQSNLAGDGNFHPFLWTAPGPMQDLGTLGGSYGFANAINESGDVVGQVAIAGDQVLHAFIWRHGVMTDLGTLPNFDASCIGAFGINAQGQVVGQAVVELGPSSCVPASGQRAFLWEDGDMIDLNVLVSPSSDLRLADVERINDRGEMIGNALLPNGDQHAVLLIPCDENHPDVGGCDYSMVSANAVAFEQPQARGPFGAQMADSNLVRVLRQQNRVPMRTPLRP